MVKIEQLVEGHRMLEPLRISCARLALLACIAATSGCSFGMALSGDEAPDLAACRVDADQATIDEQLGPPVTVRKLPDGGQSCVYEYEIGNEPSPGRAAMHGTLDVVTFGLWELVGTPIEASRGRKYRMTVVYDADGKAREISTIKVD